METNSAAKSGILFDMIGRSEGFYSLIVEPKYRSRVNIPFRVCKDDSPNDELEVHTSHTHSHTHSHHTLTSHTHTLTHTLTPPTHTLTHTHTHPHTHITHTHTQAMFLKESAERGLLNLKGYRLVGGIRASLYNAVSVMDTKKLADFMRWFYEEYKLRN